MTEAAEPPAYHAKQEVGRRFMDALSNGDLEGVRAAIADGVDVNWPASTVIAGLPLYLSVADHPSEMVDLLIQAGAKWERIDPSLREDTLYFAIKNKDPWLPHIVRAFIPHAEAAE